MSMGTPRTTKRSGGISSIGQMEPGTISIRSIGRFRTSLNPEEIAYIQMSCGRYMKRYGYGSESTGLSSRERPTFLVKDTPLTFIRVAGWITVDRVRELRGRTVPDRRLANASP